MCNCCSLLFLISSFKYSVSDKTTALITALKTNCPVKDALSYNVISRH